MHTRSLDACICRAVGQTLMFSPLCSLAKKLYTFVNPLHQHKDGPFFSLPHNVMRSLSVRAMNGTLQDPERLISGQPVLLCKQNTEKGPYAYAVFHGDTFFFLPSVFSFQEPPNFPESLWNDLSHERLVFSRSRVVDAICVAQSTLIPSIGPLGHAADAPLDGPTPHAIMAHHARIGETLEMCKWYLDLSDLCLVVIGRTFTSTGLSPLSCYGMSFSGNKANEEKAKALKPLIHEALDKASRAEDVPHCGLYSRGGKPQPLFSLSTPAPFSSAHAWMGFRARVRAHPFTHHLSRHEDNSCF